MAWQDEIGGASYTAPSGKKIEFNFESGLSRKTPLKTAENTFPDVDGAEIQSLGLGGKKFPMTALFNGGDCLTQASEFEEALCERGVGVLEHPIYGKMNVVPTGEIERVDNLVDSLNESRVKVTFAETIVDESFPDGEVAAVDDLDTAADAYEDAAAESFADMIETASIDDQLQLQSVLKAHTDAIFKGIDKIMSKVDKVLETTRKIQKKIQTLKKNIQKMLFSVDKMVAAATEIATAIIQIARLPSEIAIDAMAKIEGYATIATNILNNVKKDPVGAAAIKNQFAATSAALGGIVAANAFGVAKSALKASRAPAGGQASGGGNGSAGGNSGGASGGNSGGSGSSGAGGSTMARVSGGGFASRADALQAAEQIAALFENYKNYMDAQTAKNAFVDSGEGYAALLETVVTSIKIIQTYSFSLPTTRIKKLGRDRQTIELLCELYGAEGFSRLDEFIMDNKLNADEIVLLPMGREVRYYA